MRQQVRKGRVEGGSRGPRRHEKAVCGQEVDAGESGLLSLYEISVLQEGDVSNARPACGAKLLTRQY